MSDWSPGVFEHVEFMVKHRTKRGRIVSGPVGRHLIYVVEVRRGERYDVPLVLLEPASPS